MKVIDLTPTWRGLMPALVEVAVNGTTVEGRKLAMDQLYLLADTVDRMNREAREGQKMFRSLSIFDYAKVSGTLDIAANKNGRPTLVDSRVWQITFDDHQRVLVGPSGIAVSSTFPDEVK